MAPLRHLTRFPQTTCGNVPVPVSVLAERLGLTILPSVHEGVVLVRLTNTQVVNQHEMRALIDKVKHHLRGGRGEFVIDLSEVTRMPSGGGSPAGLGFISWVVARAPREGAKVVFVGLTREVTEVFEITRIAQLIHHFATVAEALAYLEQSR